MFPRALGEDLRLTARRRPRHPAVVAGEGRIDFAELDERADGLAAGLRARGVGDGDRVALVLGNEIDMAIAVYGVARAGAAFCPVNPTTKHERLAYMLKDAGAAAVVVSAEARHEAVEAAAEAGIEVVGDVATLSGAGEEAPRAQPLDVDLAAIIYTSGSTGVPKGVTLTHRNVTFVADSIIEYLEIGEEDRILCVLPLSFGYGLFHLLMCVRVGGTLVLEPGFAFAGRILSVLAEQRITGLPGVPTVWAILTAGESAEPPSLPDLRFITNAGAALSEGMAAEVRRTFPGARLYPMYGLTECLRVCYLPPEDLDRKPGSVGIAIPGTEAWVADEDGTRLGPGEVGELMVRGSHVMQGYWNDPEATAERLRPGRWPWERTLATGDLFRTDEDGYLFWAGRRDDMIKSRGEKVMPREVEDVVLGVAGVADAVVTGAPDRILGQAIHVHVAPRPGEDLDAGTIRRACAEQLESHKVPKKVHLHEEMPKTPNGKVDRAALRALSRGG